MAQIYGKIFETDGVTPRADVIVAVATSDTAHRDLAAMTDTNGDYALTGLHAGTHVVRAVNAEASVDIDHDEARVRCDLTVAESGPTAAESRSDRKSSARYSCGYSSRLSVVGEEPLPSRAVATPSCKSDTERTPKDRAEASLDDPYAREIEPVSVDAYGCCVPCEYSTSDPSDLLVESQLGPIASEDEESFGNDPYGRDEESGAAEAAEISLIDKGLVYAALSLKLATGLRDRNALTDVAYATLHPDETLPFSTADLAFEAKTQVWLDLRKIVDLLLAGTAPAEPAATSAEAFGLRAVRLPDGPGYKVRRNGINFGLPEVVEAIRAIGAAWHRRHPNVELWCLDMSKREGGRLYPPHKSHACFLDWDCQLRIRGEKLCMSKRRYSERRHLVQDLVNDIRANGVLPIKAIGYSDPEITGVSNWGGHTCHLHVRFCAPPDAIDKVEAAVAALYADQPRNKRPNYRCSAGAFEAAPNPDAIGPALELYPTDYLDVEGAAEAGISLVQRGLVYATVGLAYARGLRSVDHLTDEGWKAVYPEAPFPLRSWHEAFAKKRRTWLEVEKMVRGFLAGIADGPQVGPTAPTVCANKGRAELQRIARMAEAAGAPEGFAIFAEAAAWTESRWNNCAVNDSASEAAAARKLFEGARSRGWFPDTPFGADDFGFGSGGWFGLMPATGLIAGGNRGPFINADPRIVTNPVESIVMIADFCVRISRKYKANDPLSWRKAMASLEILHDKDEAKQRSVEVRERFEVGLREAGVADPKAFMRSRSDTSDYPGAWALLMHLDAES